MADEQPNETLVTLGEQSPVEYSIKPSAEPDRGGVYNFVKRDNRSPESRQKDAELRRESTIQRIKEKLASNLPGREIVADFDQNVTGEEIASMIREAKDRLARERAEEQEAIEDRRAEFQRRLQESRFVCPHCKAVCGWDQFAEERHNQTCSLYQEHKRAEEAHFTRRKNFKER